MAVPIPVIGAKGYDGPERRRFLRKRTSTSSCIVYGIENLIVDCTIRDFGEAGARISVINSQSVPDSIMLLEPSSFMAFDATVKWRYGNLLGLAFDRKVSIASNEIDRLYLLRRKALEFSDLLAKSASNSL